MRRLLPAILAAVCIAPVSRAQEIPLPPPLPRLAPPDPAKAELGRMLFFERRLSGDGTMSCAACHIPREAFADGRPLSEAYPTNRHWRHTPSLVNAAHLDRLLWDGRADSLEEQAEEAIRSPFEMNLDPDYLAARLAEEPEYAKRFRSAFGGGPTRERIVAALAAFERTLTVTDSPFDRYLAEDRSALSPEALRGAALFFGERGRCGECHSGPLLSDGKFHPLGIEEPAELREDPLRRATRSYFLLRRGLSPLDYDPGRHAVSRDPADGGAFRTPPLRQVAATSPYMHNGTLKTLEEVIDFFDRGGGNGPRKSPLLRPLALTPAQKGDLLAFLRALSGTLPEVRPPALPGE